MKRCRVSFGWCFEHMCHSKECKRPYFMIDGHRIEVEYDDIQGAYRMIKSEVVYPS